MAQPSSISWLRRDSASRKRASKCTALPWTSQSQSLPDGRLDDSQDFVSKAGEGEDYEMATERPSWDIERFLTAIESLRVHRNASGAARKKPLLLLLILSKLHHRQ